MTESLSGARTPERGGSAVVEQLPVAKTYSTTAAQDSNLVFCWELREGGGTGAGRAGETRWRSECRGEAEATTGCASGPSAAYGVEYLLRSSASPPGSSRLSPAAPPLLPSSHWDVANLGAALLRCFPRWMGRSCSHMAQGPARLIRSAPLGGWACASAPRHTQPALCADTAGPPFRLHEVFLLSLAVVQNGDRDVRMAWRPLPCPDNTRGFGSRKASAQIICMLFTSAVSLCK